MTGGGFFPTAQPDDYELDELNAGVGGSHAVQWVGTPGIKGPKWARVPLLTFGMLGIQCVWSIEMGYASPYLLDLGLSKSLMSLVFMAGPLSGLIVQPLIGIFADRSQSPYGRRRPYMLIGCTICAFAMLLLGWTREAAGWLGAGNWMAVGLAVLCIYGIDFSINAVMSTDRALVVDTLSPGMQEEGSAWAGRMFGFGSLMGFFVGNLDLPPYLGWLGKTQLQILGFLTSCLLMGTHGFTSWAVTERVLLRDDRPQSRSNFKANIRAIWENIFTLPPGIRTVCFIQFFGSLSWFPVLFFTTLWVSEIYMSSHPDLDPTDPAVASDAVRSGARALFFQALVNIVVSVGLPFFISDSGIRPRGGGAGEYAVVRSEGHGLGVGVGVGEIPNSAVWKRGREERGDGGFVSRVKGLVDGLIKGVRDGSALVLPIKGLTLVKVWYGTCFLFAATMGATWFVTTVEGAYLVIAITGISWAVTQWAPYAILGELILLEGNADRASAPVIHRTRPSDELEDRPHRLSDSEPRRSILSAPSSSRNTPIHSRHSSRTSLATDSEKPPNQTQKKKRPPPQSLELNRTISSSSTSRASLSPMINQQPQPPEYPTDTSIILHHADEHSTTSDSDMDDDDVDTPRSPIRSGKDTADKAGVILGIHNVFLVLPQFVVTGLSSLVFWVMEPGGGKVALEVGSGGIEGVGEGSAEVERVVRSLGGGTGSEGGSPDAVGLIFRIGGISAAIGAVLCMRASKRWARGEGI